MACPWLTVLAIAGAALAAGADDTTWKAFVRSPPSKTVLPVSVLSQYTAGNVSNADGLLGSGTGPTVLSRLTADDVVPTIVLDFGINIAGHLSIDFAGSSNPSASEGLPGITLAFSETLQYLGDRSDFTRSDNAGSNRITAGTDQIAVRNGSYTWTDEYGCENGTQVCSDGLHGFRYVKIRLAALPTDAPLTSALGSVSIAAVRLQYSGFLGTPDTFTGHFECSDTDLTQWWYDAVYTNDLCTDIFRANESEPRNAESPTLLGKLVLLDGPKRDRDPYVGDLAVAGLTTYLSHNASEAARNVLEDLANHQRDDGWIPPASIVGYTLPLFDYPLWWVVSSADYVMYTGNASYWTAYFPALVKVLDNYYPAHTNSDTMLIERPDGAGDFAFVPRTGAVTYYNALYVHALRYAARVAQAMGDDDAASRWKARAALVGPALLQRNFDSSAGAFFDGGACSGNSMCPTHAQDGNSLAILAGVVPSGLSANTSAAESILSFMNASMARPYGNAFYDNDNVGAGYSDRVYAFISYFEVAARFATSFKASQGALEELQRLHGWMASHDPSITLWEGIGQGGSPYEGGFTSMSHGWSTGIVPLMINYVLGVTPTAPGFEEWSIKPTIDTIELTWASGRVPTPNGDISVQWTKQSGGYALTIDTPTRTRGTVTVSFANGRAASVAVDGKAVQNLQATAGYVTLSLSGGRHVIDVR